MPTYTMINKESKEESEMILTMAERTEFLSLGTHTQKLSTASFISQAGSTLSKTPDSWNDHLKQVKKGSGRINTVNTK
jgi:hypothetical protein